MEAICSRASKIGCKLWVAIDKDVHTLCSAIDKAINTALLLRLSYSTLFLFIRPSAAGRYLQWHWLHLLAFYSQIFRRADKDGEWINYVRIIWLLLFRVCQHWFSHGRTSSGLCPTWSSAPSSCLFWWRFGCRLKKIPMLSSWSRPYYSHRDASYKNNTGCIRLCCDELAQCFSSSWQVQMSALTKGFH